MFRRPARGHGLNFDHIFIITYGRSGSTLLQGILNAIDGVLVRGENANALFHMYAAYDALRLAKRKLARLDRNAEGPRPEAEKNPWFGLDEVSLKRLRREIRDTFVSSVLCPPAGIAVTGFKEIRYGPTDMSDEAFEGYMRFLRRAFPRAALIFNTRDVEATAASGWWPRRFDDPVTLIAERDARLRAYVAKQPRGCFHVHYDDYKDEAEALRPLFDFLGAPFHADKLRAVMGEQHSFVRTGRRRTETSE